MFLCMCVLVYSNNDDGMRMLDHVVLCPASHGMTSWFVIAITNFMANSNSYRNFRQLTNVWD